MVDSDNEKIRMLANHEMFTYKNKVVQL